MAKKKVGRPGEERRARELLDRIAKKKAAKTETTREDPSQGVVRQITERLHP